MDKLTQFQYQRSIKLIQLFHNARASVAAAYTREVGKAAHDGLLLSESLPAVALRTFLL